MGEVFEVWDETEKRAVARKRMYPYTSEDPQTANLRFRREFHTLAAAGLTTAILGGQALATPPAMDIEPWDPTQPPRKTGRALRVQPVLVHAIMSPKEKTSWRSWSEIVNEPAAEAEREQRLELDQEPN